MNRDKQRRCRIFFLLSLTSNVDVDDAHAAGLSTKKTTTKNAPVSNVLNLPSALATAKISPSGEKAARTPPTVIVHFKKGKDSKQKTSRRRKTMPSNVFAFFLLLQKQTNRRETTKTVPVPFSLARVGKTLEREREKALAALALSSLRSCLEFKQKRKPMSPKAERKEKKMVCAGKKKKKKICSRSLSLPSLSLVDGPLFLSSKK